MAATPNRRWYQFSLQRLFLVVTIARILTGSRVGYLRWNADYHARDAKRFAAKAQPFDQDSEVWDLQDWQKYSHHKRLANEYCTAISRPWTRVDARMKGTELDWDMDLDRSGFADLFVSTKEPTP